MTFIEDEHPRDAGKFTDKDQSAPEVGLAPGRTPYEQAESALAAFDDIGYWEGNNANAVGARRGVADALRDLVSASTSARRERAHAALHAYDFIEYWEGNNAPATLAREGAADALRGLLSASGPERLPQLDPAREALRIYDSGTRSFNDSITGEHWSTVDKLADALRALLDAKTAPSGNPLSDTIRR